MSLESPSLELFKEWSEGAGLELSAEQMERFGAFRSSLYEANLRTNLTRVSEEDCWSRHFVDSLLFHDAFFVGADVLDIGTGPGFPAWPLACARPDLQVTAVDSNGKMLSFLRTQPLPNLKIVEARVEEWRAREKFDFVTGRAVAPLAVQLEISVRACRVNGSVIPMRTPSDDLRGADLDALGLELAQVWSRKLPGTEMERVLPLFRKVRATDPRLPRRWAEIKVKPLLAKSQRG